MEAKLLQESQSMLQKMFQGQDAKKTGFISSNLMNQLLETLHLEIDVPQEELKSQIALVDPDETGQLNYEAFSKVVLHFLVKESKNEANAFGDKRDINLGFFDK